MDINEIVSTKLNNANITPAAIEVAIEEVKFSILNYCNIDEIPLGLKYVWANMSAELCSYQYESTKATDSDIADVDSADVSSIKIGDTQVQLQGGNASSNRNKILKSHTPNLDQIVLNYKSQLNKYRRMVW